MPKGVRTATLGPSRLRESADANSSGRQDWDSRCSLLTSTTVKHTAVPFHVVVGKGQGIKVHGQKNILKHTQVEDWAKSSNHAICP